MKGDRYEVQTKVRSVINTDPQRRCYNGCNFSERIEWSEWRHFVSWPTKEAADKCCDVYTRDRNPDRKYRVVDLGVEHDTAAT